MSIRPHVAFLRVLAIAVGTYYVYGGFYLVWHSDFDFATKLGYFGAAAGQIAIGVILVGVGLGAWRIVLNAKAR